jgi:hypothetical protein
LVVAVGSAEVEFRFKWKGDFSACLSFRIQDLKILPVNDTKPHGRVKKEHGWRCRVGFNLLNWQMSG